MLQIPPDYTFVVQIALFLALWIALKRLWFDPAMAISRERAVRSEGAIAEAKALQGRAEAMRAEHAQKLAEARAEAQRDAQEILRGAEVEHRRLVNEASEEAQKTIAEARQRIAEDVATARRTLRADVESIAGEVARVVMGRSAR